MIYTILLYYAIYNALPLLAFLSFSLFSPLALSYSIFFSVSFSLTGSIRHIHELCSCVRLGERSCGQWSDQAVTYHRTTGGKKRKREPDCRSLPLPKSDIEQHFAYIVARAPISNNDIALCVLSIFFDCISYYTKEAALFVYLVVGFIIIIFFERRKKPLTWNYNKNLGMNYPIHSSETSAIT